MTGTSERLLVVDDDPGVVDYLVEELQDAGYEVEGEVSPLRARDRVRAERFDLVIADIEMPELRGIDLLKAVHRHRPDQLVLLITAFGSIDLAVQSVRAGACDFVTKPFRIEVLLLAVERALRERRMRREIVRLRRTMTGTSPGSLVARSPAMRRAVELADRAARTDAPVLMTGESGVGKSALARHIHGQSDRASGPFVQVNCAALPATLAESELFGVRRGAFTDAREDREGLFVQARGGTLFLDEITEMPLETQPKLLQALDTRRVRPLGGTREVEVDVRLIAATNRPLEDALRERQFRPDLYYRLNVIRLEVPPLRERPEDIDALSDVFLQRCSETLDRPVFGIPDDAVRWMRSYPWPGNVRELANAVERAVALTDHDCLVLEDLRPASSDPGSATDALRQAATEGWTLEELDQRYIEQVMEVTGGNKAMAARVLGIDRRTLYRKMESRSHDDAQEDETERGSVDEVADHR